jgi:membrane fusion protein
VATIVANRAGVLTRLTVRDGDTVDLGATLGTVQAEAAAIDEPSPTYRMAEAIERRRASVAERVEAAATDAATRKSRILAQRRGLLSEMAQLSDQIAIQRRLVATAETDLARLDTLRSSDFVTPRDFEQREELVLSRRKSLSELNQSLLAKRHLLNQIDIESSNLDAMIRSERASLSALQAQSDEDAAAVAEMRGYNIYAPIGGRVTALTARVGQPVAPDRGLMMLVPTSARPIAELRVPSSSIGFVRIGQRVRLAIDSFPYQSFGTIGGTITTVARAPIVGTDVDNTRRSYYPVTVAIESSSIEAYGRAEPLVFGMTLSARIVIERRSLLEWLFEPLLAVQRRQAP